MSYLSFCHWLISSDIMTLRFIHVVCVAEFPCFLRLNNILLCEYPTFCVFVHLLWAFGSLPHLAIMNNAALKGVYKCLLKILLSIPAAGSCGSSILNFWRNP